MDGAYISGRLFDVLGVTAIRGRIIAPPTTAAPARDGPVAVISHRLWRQRFAGASDVVGRQLTVQRVPFTIVGVMPPGFFGPDVGQMMDVMLPFAAEPLVRGKEEPIGKQGLVVAADHGAPEAGAWPRAGERRAPRRAAANRRRRESSFNEPLTLAPAATGNSSLRTRFERPLFAMVVAVGLVLLVACANIASLLCAGAGASPRAQRAPGTGELTLADRAAALSSRV